MSTDETTRLNALQKYRILDTDPEQAFDDLTLLASQICDTPIALISLIGEDRQWFKSRVGLAVAETSRSISFCTHAIQQSELFLVPDALNDERFRENPLVIDNPHIRFYAGAPLRTRDGNALGTLCVLDRRPRTLTAEQLESLAALKRQVEAQLELRRNLIELRGALEGIERLGALVPPGSTCELNIVIPADLDSMATVRDQLNELLESKHWSEEEIDNVDLALDEALSNAIRHGCKNDATKNVQCLVSFDDSGELSLVVRDPGSGFDPSIVPDPREAKNLLKSGGRGVMLISRLMDIVEYSEEGRQLSMRKRRESTGEA